ncbi:hypothetical protein DUNSADRAFT_17150 [Dunaliella salina]|uniref:Uncharacterized protein n=1 Tax=Dunaliella salina TaxID=3046 RepID=A0ABQ7H0B6_DUNSA|nr:hypothetical protein DUNSADRAFT_17150 [Dunaliella salina]|eukprot:KAF5840306.1 hypothetical protein DUNSADRAFT_17150 [Dunaliella salina]
MVLLPFFWGYDEIRRIYAVGYDYAARLHANGCFDNFDLAEVLLEGPGRNMQELLVPKQQEKEFQVSPPLVHQHQHQHEHHDQHQHQHQQEERADGGLVLDLEYDALVKGEKQ